MTGKMRIWIGSSLSLLLIALAALWLSADRLLDGVVRPWLIDRSAAALDAEVRLEHLAYQGGYLQLSGLSLTRPGEFALSVTAIEVRLAWRDLLQRRVGEVLVREPRLVWTASAHPSGRAPEDWPPAPPLEVAAWRLENGRAELAWQERRVVLDQLQAEGAVGRHSPFVVRARCGAPPGALLRIDGAADWRDGFALTIDQLAWNEQGLLHQPLHVTPGNGMALGVQLSLPRLDDREAASLLAALDQPVPWAANLSWSLAEPAIEVSLRAGVLSATLQTAAGAVEAGGQRWSWLDLALQAQGDAERLELSGTLGLAGSGRLQLQGGWAGQRLAGDWELAVGRPASLLRSLGLVTEPLPIEPRDLGAHGRIEAGLEDGQLSASQLAVTLGDLGRLEGTLRGEWRKEQLTLASDGLALTAPQDSARLAEATLSMNGSADAAAWQGKWTLRVPDANRLARAGGVTLGEELPVLNDLALEGGLAWRQGQLRLPGIALSGRLSGPASGLLQGELQLRAAAGADLALRLDRVSLEAVDYQAGDGLAGLAGGRLVLSGQLDLAGDQLGFDLAGQVRAEEALLRGWYGRLADLPVGFAARGTWRHEPRQLELAALEVDLAGLASGHFAGRHDAGASSLRGRLAVPKLAGAFQQRLQSLAGDLFPAIGKLTLAGQLLVDVAAQRQAESWDLELVLAPQDVTVASGDSGRIEGLSGRLPVHLLHGPAAPAPAQRASLQWTLLQGGLLSSRDGRLELSASANRWQLHEPLELSAAGGTLQLTALRLSLVDLVPQMQASLALREVELRQLSRAMGGPEMGGRLNARLEEVRIGGDEIRTDGGAALQAFGGEITLQNMRVEAPFSRFPTYHADVEFSGIDLYQLTNTFAFGEMNGIADGYIRQLRLFDGTPSAFRGRLETRQEGTRNISVKAIRNLNTLSQGGLSSALSQGVYQFIDFYRYRKIGILCWLQNDLFHLEGTAREDSDQYLVYGGLLPPRIDVVVSSPTISFKEMVRRLRRIERAEH